jgi:hypothetical protein
MPRKKITDMIEELRSLLPNYDHKQEYPQLIFRLLATLPGGDELEDMGYAPISGMGWHEADMMGRMLEAIEGKSDVEDLVAGLIREEEEVEERRRRPAVRARPATTREHPYPPPVRTTREMPRRGRR